jgi:uncharacterized protein (TIGR02217 family)
MAFWLAHQRRGQDSGWIQRFDPRFWTVNFPRPMMASVVTTAPDALRVDCEFHRKGELAGLIWESEDTLDHPLLAYATDRDYSRTTLSFRWRSGGLVALDAVNGPTLTIEGRDAAGNARNWYVRLWNYASGTPENARVTLPFSALQSGFTLPGEAVFAGDVDRMFISLVPPGHMPGSSDPLPARAQGWAELSEISCQGDRPLLEIGDILLPPHDIGMATAYDDCLNQTPARLLRTVRGLGYRVRLIHYVGMSHFFRLGADGLVDPSGALCTPAQAWHASFFAECVRLGFYPIISLSYELLAEHCPAEWQQRTWDGEPARTGWEPPSALLSPASGAAMAWLRAAAANFVALVEAAGRPVLFQVGEPWWWVMPDGRPCLYDDAAKMSLGAALGGEPPVIDDMRSALDPARTALLDAAGALLAQSTASLIAAVRAAASGWVEAMVLVFTPTVLDPDMPELKRANLPLGWKWPAFARIQLEDYDWLTAGADGLRRSAYGEVAQRLGYAASSHDYLSGFVLRPEDAEAFWPKIDAALDEAAARGVTQRFVWAAPQISRDGYVRLAPSQEDQVQAFDDVLYPLALGRDAGVSPEFSTSVAVTASGYERRNALWSDARLQFDVGPGIRSLDEMGVLIQFFRARRGAARGFRLADPFDFSSNVMTGTPTATDQLIGTGDGLAASFRLSKRYGEGSDGGEEPQVRPITRPRAETVRVSVGGAEVSGWTLAPGGTIVFETAPPAGAQVRAGFLFDVPVRFAEDRLDVTGAAFAAGEAPSVPLIEVREAA